MPSRSQLPLFTALLAECGVTEASDIGGWVAALARARAVSDGRAARQMPPYRGLEPYQPEDAEFFFGRETTVQLVVDRLVRLRDEPGRSRGVLAVVGPSGSGKSSLLRAGVVPAVRAGALNNEQLTWTCEVVTPASDPPPAPTGAALAGDGGSRLLIIDQFEEVFTALSDPGQRRAYIEGLTDVLADGALIVLGMRADFYAAAAREPELLPALQDAQILVGPMAEDELRRAIVEPARRAGVAVDESLVDVVLSDVAPHGVGGGAHDAGALPLMSHALLSTWERAARNHLTVADYRDSGGIEGATQQTAEELYKSLSTPEQEVTRRLFLRLVNLDGDGTTTRRRVAFAELAELTADLGDEAAAKDVLNQFVARRLVTAHADAVQVSHEALLEAWPRLGEWLDADRAGLRLHRQLTHSANAWRQNADDEELLLRGGRLDAVDEWARDPAHRGDLNGVERDFLEASVRHAQTEQAAARRRTRRLQRLLAAAAVLAVTAGGLAAYALHAQSTANTERKAATRARDEALSREVAIESIRVRATDPALADQLALTAYRIWPTTDARSVLLDTSAQPAVTRLIGPSGPTALAMTGDGRLVAVGHADDGSVRIYRRAPTGRLTEVGTIPGGGADAQLFALAFSPDSTVLATGGAAKQVQLWNVSDQSHPRHITANLAGFGNVVQSIAFSPDGHTLVAGGTTPAVRMWNLASTDPIAPLTAPAGLPKDVTGQSIGFSTDGQTLAVGGSDGAVRLWPVNHVGAAPTVLKAGTSTIDGVAFSPDDTTLAAGSKDGTLRLWRLGGARPQPLHAPDTGFTSWVDAIAFSPDGRSLAAGSSDNTLEVWNTATWSRTATMPHPGPVTGVRFSPDSKQILSTDADGTLRIWPTTTGIPVSGSVFTVAFSHDGRLLDLTTSGDAGTAGLWNATDPDHPMQVMPDLHLPSSFGPTDGASAIMPDGRTIATGNSSGHLLLWDTSTPSHPVPIGAQLTGPTALIESIAFSPDQHLLAAGSDDNKTYLWDIHDLRHPIALAPLTGAKSIVLFVTFSPDSRLIVAASADNTARLYDVHDPTHVRQVAVVKGFKNYAWSAGFSPDGRTLAVGSADHTIRMWDISRPSHPRQLGGPLEGPSNYVAAVSFSHDGKTLAAGSDDNTIWLYDVGDRTRPENIATLRASAGPIYAMTFSPHGHTLVGAGGDPVARFWDIDPTRVAARVCATAGDPITPAEWTQYVPGAPFRKLCS